MSYYEYQDIMTGVFALITNIATVYMSVFVAFLVCAYLVGKDLSKFQAVAISVVYTAFTIFLLLLILGNLSRINGITAEYYQVDPGTIPTRGYIGVVIFGIGWALSLVYMLQVRKK